MSAAAISSAEGGGIYQTISRDILGGNYILQGGSMGDNVTVEDVLVDLSSYPKAASAKVKAELIRRIGQAVRRLGAKVNMKNQDTILESIRKYLPDPDKKTTIRASKGKLKEMAKTIAKVINNVFSQSSEVQVINLNQPTEYLIRDVATHIWGLSCGTQIEFYKIYGILKTTLDQLQALETVAQKVVEEKMDKAVRGSKNIKGSTDVLEAKIAVKAALGQIKNLTNQVRLATNILATDENKILVQLDKHKNRFDRITTHVDAWNTTDTGAAGDTIARLLSTLNNTTILADIIDNSLKEVSLTMSQFKNFKTFNCLMDNVMSKITRLNPDREGEKIGKMLYHLDELKKYFGRRHSIKGGGIEDESLTPGDLMGGAYEMASEAMSSEAATYMGGDSSEEDDLQPNIEGGSSFLSPEENERIAKKKRAQLAVKAFVDEMNSQINDFVQNVYEGSKYLGDTRYDTDKVVDILENMKYMEALRDPNIYLALVGYYTDDSYRTLSSQYRERLDKTARGFKTLAQELPGARKYLSAASDNITQIVKKVDFFADLLKTLLSSTSLPDIKDIVSHIPSSMGNITTALNRFYHALNISKMRRNIKISGCDLNKYTEDYPELLSWAVGNRRQRLETEYKLLTAEPQGATNLKVTGMSGDKFISDDDVKACSLVYWFVHEMPKKATGELIKAYGEGASAVLGRNKSGRGFSQINVPDNLEADKSIKGYYKSQEMKTNFVKLLREVDDEFRAKHRLYKALESLDLLLSSFTKELVNDIELIKEVKKYLDDTKVYTKWFTDYTGNLLAAVFESMPVGVNIAGITSTGNDVSTNPTAPGPLHPGNKGETLKYDAGGGNVNQFFAGNPNEFGTRKLAYNSKSGDEIVKNVINTGIQYERLGNALWNSNSAEWKALTKAGDKVGPNFSLPAEDTYTNFFTFRKAGPFMGDESPMVEAAKYMEKLGIPGGSKFYLRETLLRVRGFSNFDPSKNAGWDWSASIFMGSTSLVSDLKLGETLDKTQDAKKIPPLKVSSFARAVIDNGSLWGYPQYSGLARVLMNPTTTSHYYTLLAQRINSAPMTYKDYYGKALGVVCMDRKGETRKNIDDFYNNFQALKNIFHSFISLYNRIIEKNIRQVSIMSPSQIYYSILSYLKQSALARRDLNPGCTNLLSAEDYMSPAGSGSSDITNPRTHFSAVPWSHASSQYPYGTILGRTTLATRLVGMILPGYYPSAKELDVYSSSHYSNDGRWLNIGEWGLGGPGTTEWEVPGAPDGSFPAPTHHYTDALTGANVPLVGEALAQAAALNTAKGMIAHPPSERNHKGQLSLEGLKYNKSVYCTNFKNLKSWEKGFVGQPIDLSKDFLDSHYRSVYECEDRYCAMGIKSVASAVLSCIGLFTVTQQPVNMGLQRTVRSILGGGDDEQVLGGLGLLTSSLYSNFDSAVTPSISPGAFDSYYYIIKLAEFYKILFDKLAEKQAYCFGKDHDENQRGTIKWSLKEGGVDTAGDYVMRLPIDMEGEFGKILFIVNQKNRGEQQDYSDIQCKVIINEVNQAYQKYKDTNETVLAFVKEVNRRFSILADKEANKTLKVFEERIESRGPEGALELTRYGQEATGSMPFSDESYGDGDGINLDNIITPSDALATSFTKYSATDYDVLEGTDDYEYNPTSASTSTNPLRKRALEKYRLGCDFKLYQKLAMFRTELDRFFDDYLKTNDSNNMRGSSYKLSTKAFTESYHGDFVHDMKERLKQTKSNNELQFQLSCELINSKGRGTLADRGGINSDTLIAFNETVALMTDGLDNARDLLRVVLQDMAAVSGNIMAYENRTNHGLHLVNKNNTDGAVIITNYTVTAAGIQANGGQTWIPQTAAPTSVDSHKEWIMKVGTEDNPKEALKIVIADTLAMSYLWTINNDINSIIEDGWGAKVDAEGPLVTAPMVSRNAGAGPDNWKNNIYRNAKNFDPSWRWQAAIAAPGTYRYFVHSAIYKRIAKFGTHKDITGGNWKNGRFGAAALLNFTNATNPMHSGAGANANWSQWVDPNISFEDCIPEQNESLIVTYCKEMAFYNVFLSTMIDKYNGIRYLGIGALGSINTFKNVALLIAGPPKEKRPFWLAYNKYAPYSTSMTNVDTENNKRQFLAEAINHTLMRLDLTFLQTTLIGSVTRLSSSLGANVSTTISTQGTYMDVTPLQNLLIDCLGELKSYAALFYDNLPKGFMQPYYQSADTTSPTIIGASKSPNMGIYQLEYDLTTVFQPHVHNQIRFPPLIASANTVLTNTHKALISNLPNVLLPATPSELYTGGSTTTTLREHIDMSQYMGIDKSEYYTTLSPYNRGAAAILGSVMPSHHRAIKLGSLYSYNELLTDRLFTATGDNKADIEPLLKNTDDVMYLADLSNGSYLNALLPALNYGIKSMIENFYDYGARKIYKGILDAILGTKLSKNIENLSSSYPDIVQGTRIAPSIAGGGQEHNLAISMVFNSIINKQGSQYPKITAKFEEYRSKFTEQAADVGSATQKVELDGMGLVPAGMYGAINPMREKNILGKTWGSLKIVSKSGNFYTPITGKCGAGAPGTWDHRIGNPPINGTGNSMLQMEQRTADKTGNPTWIVPMKETIRNNFVGITRERALKIAMIELLGGTPTYLDPTWKKAIQMPSDNELWGDDLNSNAFTEYKTLFSTAGVGIDKLLNNYTGGYLKMPLKEEGDREFSPDSLISQLRLFNSYAALLPCTSKDQYVDLGNFRPQAVPNSVGLSVLGLPLIYPAAIANPMGTIQFYSKGGQANYKFDANSSYEPIKPTSLNQSGENYTSLDWYNSVGFGSAPAANNAPVSYNNLYNAGGVVVTGLNAQALGAVNKNGAQFFETAYPYASDYQSFNNEGAVDQSTYMGVLGDKFGRIGQADYNIAVDKPVSVCDGGANCLWQQLISLPFRSGVYNKWDTMVPNDVKHKPGTEIPQPPGAISNNMATYEYAQKLISAGVDAIVSDNINKLSEAMGVYLNTMIKKDKTLVEDFKDDETYLFTSWITCGLNMQNYYMSGGTVEEHYSRLISDFGDIAEQNISQRRVKCDNILEKELELAAFINYSMTVGSNNVSGNLNLNASLNAPARARGLGQQDMAKVNLVHANAKLGQAPALAAVVNSVYDWSADPKIKGQGYIPAGNAWKGRARWAPPWWQNLYISAVTDIQTAAQTLTAAGAVVNAVNLTNELERVTVNNPLINIFDLSQAVAKADPRQTFQGFSVGPGGANLDGVMTASRNNVKETVDGQVGIKFNDNQFNDQFSAVRDYYDRSLNIPATGTRGNIGGNSAQQWHFNATQSNYFRIPSTRYLGQAANYIIGKGGPWGGGGGNRLDKAAQMNIIPAAGAAAAITGDYNILKLLVPAKNNAFLPGDSLREVKAAFKAAFPSTRVLYDLRGLKYNPLDVCLAKSYVSDNGYLFNSFKSESPYYATMNATVGGNIGAPWGDQGNSNYWWDQGNQFMRGSEATPDMLKMKCNQWEEKTGGGANRMAKAGDLLWGSDAVQQLLKDAGTRGYPWEQMKTGDQGWGRPEVIATLCDDGSMPFTAPTATNNTSKLWTAAGKLNNFLREFWESFWTTSVYNPLIKNLMISAGADPTDVLDDGGIGKPFFTSGKATGPWRRTGGVADPINENSYTANTCRAYAQVRLLFNTMFLYNVRTAAQFEERFGDATASGGSVDVEDMKRYMAELSGSPTGIGLVPSNLFSLIQQYFATKDPFSGSPEGEYIQYPIPKADSLLCTSLAIILRKIYTATPSSRAITASPVFLYETLADVKNDALLDVYKLKLPMYREYFLKLANKCRVLRAFMTKGCGSRENKRRLMSVVCPWIRKLTSVNNYPAVYNINQKFLGDGDLDSAELIDCHMVFSYGKDKFTPDKYIDDVSPLIPIYDTDEAILGDNVFYNTAINTDEARYSYLIELISNIEDSCTYIAGSCDNILEDFVLNDKFMSLGSEFTEEHKRKHDCANYTPLSLISAFSTPSPKYLSLHDLNSRRSTDAFKLQYGAKDILFSDTLKFLNEKYIHGAVNVVKGVNSLSSVRLDISNYYTFIKRYLHLFRFNYSVLNYAEQNVTSGSYKSTDFRGGGTQLIGGEDVVNKRTTIEIVQAILGQAVGYNRQYIPQGDYTAMNNDGFPKFNPYALTLSYAKERPAISGLLGKDRYSQKFTIQKINTSSTNPQGLWLVDYCNDVVGQKDPNSPFPQSLNLNDDALKKLIAYVYALPQPDVVGRDRTILPCMNLYIFEILRILDVWKYLNSTDVRRGMRDRSVLIDLTNHTNNMLERVFTDTTTSNMIWSRTLSNPKSTDVDLFTRNEDVTDDYMQYARFFHNDDVSEDRSKLGKTILRYANKTTNMDTNYKRQQEGRAKLQTAIADLKKGDIKETLEYFNRYILGTLLIKKDAISTASNEKSGMCCGWTIQNPLVVGARILWDPMMWNGTYGTASPGWMANWFAGAIDTNPTRGPFTEAAYEQMMAAGAGNLPKALSWVAGNTRAGANQAAAGGSIGANMGAIGNLPHDTPASQKLWTYPNPAAPGVLWNGRVMGSGSRNVGTWREATVANFVPDRNPVGYNNASVNNAGGAARYQHNSSNWLWLNSQYGPQLAGQAVRSLLMNVNTTPGAQMPQYWSAQGDADNLWDVETRLATALFNMGIGGWGFPNGIVTDGMSNMSYVTTPLQSGVQRIMQNSQLSGYLNADMEQNQTGAGVGTFDTDISFWGLINLRNVRIGGLQNVPDYGELHEATIGLANSASSPFASLWSGYVPSRNSRLVSLNKMADIIARSFDDQVRSLGQRGSQEMTAIANQMSHQTALLNQLKNTKHICEAWYKDSFEHNYGGVIAIGTNREQRRKYWSPFDYNTTENSGISDWLTGIDDRIYVWVNKYSDILQGNDSRTLFIAQNPMGNYGYMVPRPDATLDASLSAYGPNDLFISLVGRFINIGAITSDQINRLMTHYQKQNAPSFTRGMLLYHIILSIYSLIGESVSNVSLPTLRMNITGEVKSELYRVGEALQNPQRESRNTLGRYNIAYLAKPLPDDWVQEKDIAFTFGRLNTAYMQPVTANDVATLSQQLSGYDQSQTNYPIVTGGALTGQSEVYNLMSRTIPSGLIYTALNPPLPLTSLIQIITGEDLVDIKDVMIQNLRSLVELSDRKVTGDDCGILGNTQEMKSLVALLIELNVNPINVHSMQRFIPFANIYNYSYTLDRFIYTLYNVQRPWDQLVYAGYSPQGACRSPGQQILGFKNIFTTLNDPSLKTITVDNDKIPQDLSQVSIDNTEYADMVKEVFIRMMMDPYAKVDQYVYGLPAGYNVDAYAYFWGPIARIMKGFDQLGMGVPKFISDQLYSKVLLNSMTTIHLGPSPATDAIAAQYYSLPMTDTAPYQAPRMDLAKVLSEKAAIMGGDGDLFVGEDNIDGGGRNPDMSTWYNRKTLVHSDNTKVPAQFVEKVKVGAQGSLVPDSYIRQPVAGPVNLSGNISRMLGFYNTEERSHMRYDLHAVFSGTGAGGSGDRGPMGLGAAGDGASQKAKIPGPTVNEAYNPTNNNITGTLGFAPKECQVYRPPVQATATDDTTVAGLINQFRSEGYERFNTQIVRNAFFITNLQRLMRYAINLWLTKAYGAVSRDHRAISGEVTERRFGDSLQTEADIDYTMPSWI